MQEQVDRLEREVREWNHKCSNLEEIITVREKSGSMDAQNKNELEEKVRYLTGELNGAKARIAALG